jgi:hypothetical protein
VAKAGKKESDEPSDACFENFGLPPGINASRHTPRSPIIKNGRSHTTLSEAAFRLDRGIPSPAGQDADDDARKWVRTIGWREDDAGHAIANRFGGTTTSNSAVGNIYPQDLSHNRGGMNRYDEAMALRHKQGCDVCVHIGLLYASEKALRPDWVSYTYQLRFPGRGFEPPVTTAIPNSTDRRPGPSED